MQQIVEGYREAVGYPALVAGVWQDGGGGFRTAVGEANLRTGRPAALSDHFRIGSETKTMTATLVLQLVQRGKLRLNDPVSDYVPGVPLGRLITIRTLLDHTSGMADGPSPAIDRKLKRNPQRSFSPQQLLRGPVRAPRAGLPGEPLLEPRLLAARRGHQEGHRRAARPPLRQGHPPAERSLSRGLTCHAWRPSPPSKISG